jgi:uncharacterized OB-fold protein
MELMVVSPRPIPVPDDLSQPFWTGARNGVLVIQHCDTCGKYYHPPTVICPQCQSTSLGSREVSGRGRIVAKAVMHEGRVSGFEDKVPYACVLVELEEQRSLILGANLLGAAHDAVHVGQPVRVTFETIAPDVVLPQFELDSARIEQRGETA